MGYYQRNGRCFSWEWLATTSLDSAGWSGVHGYDMAYGIGAAAPGDRGKADYGRNRLIHRAIARVFSLSRMGKI